jgi:hypothetical protein
MLLRLYSPANTLWDRQGKTFSKRLYFHPSKLFLIDKNVILLYNFQLIIYLEIFMAYGENT